ncbi:MAG: hypothetical protein ACYC1U_11115 [Candidatus Aquicultorales bacterium]
MVSQVGAQIQEEQEELETMEATLAIWKQTGKDEKEIARLQKKIDDFRAHMIGAK